MKQMQADLDYDTIRSNIEAARERRSRYLGELIARGAQRLAAALRGAPAAAHPAPLGGVRAVD